MDGEMEIGRSKSRRTRWRKKSKMKKGGDKSEGNMIQKRKWRSGMKEKK